jgi:hypothetical protein
MEKNRISLILVIIMGFYFFCPHNTLSQSAAKVENINFYAEGTKLIVTYDIVKAKPAETFDVWIKIVTASGKEISPITITGNIGSGNTGGEGKKITWDVEADRVTLDEEFSVEVFARPEKKEEVKEKEMIQPVVIPVASGSLKAADVFMPEKNTFYWLGVDYSHVKLQVEIEPEEVKTQFFNVWNDLFLKEADKYNIKEMLKLNQIQNDTRVIKSINSEAATSEMKASIAPAYTINDITSFVSSYPSFDLNGIGILFIAEFLNRQKNEGFYHVVAINLTNNEVLLAERFRGEVGGAGFRNNWANSVFNVIEQFKKNYKSLKAKYSK